MEAWLAWGGLALGLVSIVYAIVVDRQKANLKRLTRTVFADLKRGLIDVEDNITGGLENIEDVRIFLNTLERSEALMAKLDHACWACGDFTAAHRILKNQRMTLDSVSTELFGEGRTADTTDLPTTSPT